MIEFTCKKNKTKKKTNFILLVTKKPVAFETYIYCSLLL